jgi:hypothetical protein
MKHLRPTTRQSQQIFAALVLTSILSLGAGMTFVNAAATDFVANPQGVANLKQSRTDQLPNAVANAVLRAASRELGIPISQLQITRAQQQTWNDGCLGLARPGEVCTQATVPGWRVIVQGKQQRLIYRTNNNGSLVRLNERASSANDDDLPNAVSNAVLRAASQFTGLQTSALRIVKSEQIQTNGCLSLPRPGEACTEVALNAWEVTVEAGQRRLVYRANGNASLVRLNEKASSVGDANLPTTVANAILQAASERTGLRTSELRIAKFEQIQTNGCLNLPRPGESCTKINMQAWEVTVQAGQQRLVYRSDMNASQVKLNEGASSISDANVPNSVSNAVLQLASRHFSVPTSQLKITRAEQQTWSDGCLGLPSPVERCAGTLTQGWRVVVDGKQQVQVYRTDNSGSQVRTEAISGLPSRTDNLPNSVALAVLQDAQKRVNVPASQLYILRVEQQTWPNGCLGLNSPGQVCTQALVPGWRVSVDGKSQSLVYRTNDSGSLIKLEGGATQANSGVVSIPKSELPKPLSEDAIFRVISSGGFAGRTYETTLLNDGRIVRTLITSTATASTPDITYISPKKVQEFKQMLARQPLAQFDGLSYPAPNGAADFITVTLSSRDGTVRYTDIDENRLPKELQEMIQAWNEISRGR